jgi:outer membrane receptor for ferrienterochelin and colicins
VARRRRPGRAHGREQLRRDENEVSSSLRLDRAAGDGLLSAGSSKAGSARGNQRHRSSVYSGDYERPRPAMDLLAAARMALARRLTLTAGLRGEHVAWKPRAASKRQPVGPSLAGASNWAPDLILRSSLGAGIKAPKLEEISA